MKTTMVIGDTMFSTRIDLPVESRERMTGLLNETLASLTDLYSQTKFAHWNVKGPNFIAVHKLFDELAETVEETIDDVAERITALGGIAQGTLRQAAEATTLEEFPVDTFDSSGVISAVADRFGQIANACRLDVEVANNANDPGTADLLTQTSRTFDKAIYFLASHEH